MAKGIIFLCLLNRIKHHLDTFILKWRISAEHSGSVFCFFG